MKLAVLSDIHANYTALQRAAAHIDDWGPDQVVVAGDIVNRGPRPRECWEYIRRRARQDGWRLVRGNHEDYVLSRSLPDAPRSGPAFDLHRFSYWTYRQIADYIDELRAMPFQQSLIGPDGRELRVVHASMRGNRVGIYPETKDRELAGLIHRNGEPPPAALVVGHTHRPLIRSLPGTLVVNAGSAGLPFDHDPRLSYAQLTFQDGRWQSRIVRLDYDLPQAEWDFYTTGYLSDGGPLVHLILIELLQARSQLYGWAVRYQDRVLSGELTMAESVDCFFEHEKDILW